MSDVPPLVRMDIVDRDNGLCRRCGRPGADVHHRRGRGTGGTSLPDEHSIARLVLLCTECHGHVESHRTEAYATGWAVRRSNPDTCDQIPMTDLYGRLLWLTDEGGVIYV